MEVGMRKVPKELLWASVPLLANALLWMLMLVLTK